MYGIKEKDPVVKYYDISLAKGQREEIPYFLDKVRQSGGSVLELACGTGRLSIEFAKAGYKVTSLDNSEGMLQVFKEKLQNQSKEVQERIEIINSPFYKFELSKRYKTIICCDAFFHNLSVEEEKKCLKCIKEHMEDNGVFVFNINNPNPKFLNWATSDESSDYKPRGEYDIPNTSNKLTIEESLDADLLNQIIGTKLRYTVKDENNQIIEQATSSWKSRYLFKYEAIHLLELCGFKVISIDGNYKGQSVSMESQLIFTVKKA